MTITVPYRDSSRTPLALSLSVLLHGVVAAGLLAFLWKHVPPPPPPSTLQFEFSAAPVTESTQDDSAGGAQPAPFEQSTMPKIDALPDAPPEVVPVSQPAPVVPPTPVNPVVKPVPVATSPSRPAPGARGATTAKPAASVMDLNQFQQQHSSARSSTAASPVTSGARRGPPVNVGIDPKVYGASPSRGGSGTGASRGRSTGASAETISNYLAYLQWRLQQAFQAPGGVSGQYADVQLTINPDGEVVVKKIMASSGNAAFNAAVQAALDTITQAEKPPGGQIFTSPVRFQPDGG